MYSRDVYASLGACHGRLIFDTSLRITIVTALTTCTLTKSYIQFVLLCVMCYLSTCLIR